MHRQAGFICSAHTTVNSIDTRAHLTYHQTYAMCAVHLGMRHTVDNHSAITALEREHKLTWPSYISTWSASLYSFESFCRKCAGADHTMTVMCSLACAYYAEGFWNTPGQGTRCNKTQQPFDWQHIQKQVQQTHTRVQLMLLLSSRPCTRTVMLAEDTQNRL